MTCHDKNIQNQVRFIIAFIFKALILTSLLFKKSLES